MHEFFSHQDTEGDTPPDADITDAIMMIFFSILNSYEIIIVICKISHSPLSLQ